MLLGHLKPAWLPVSIAFMTVESTMPDLSLLDRGGVVALLALILWYGGRWASNQLEEQRAEFREDMSIKDKAFADLLTKKDDYIREVVANAAVAQRDTTQMVVREMVANREVQDRVAEAQGRVAVSLDQLTAAIEHGGTTS